MQDTQCDLDSRRLGVDERHINFRPSPNFKNMKKFQKYKKDLESSSQSPPNTSSDEAPPNNTPESSPNNNKEKEKLSPVEKPPFQPPFQPPLPLDPPPPFTTPIIPMPLKQEIIDDEYPDSGRNSPEISTALSTSKPEQFNFETKAEEPDSTSTEICRDFLRGTCVRGENCRYAHKFDRTQLSNVYTFCKNYQNVRCTFPYCKYVHATVSQEQEFYRTGILPVQAKIHTPIYLMPPPPPPPPETPSTPLNVTSPLQAQMACNQIISYVSKIDTIKPAEGLKKIMTNVMSLKRERSGNSFSTPPRDFDTKENSAKKCKHCDTMDIRLQYNQEKIEDLKRSSLDLKKKATLLSKKSNALFAVLFTVLKSKASTVEGFKVLTATLNNCGEKEKALIRNILDSHRGRTSNVIT